MSAPAQIDPTQISGDPYCPDTPADQMQGALGMLAQLLRTLFRRMTPPWVQPPPGFQPFDPAAVVATPAIGNTSTVLTLSVPQGMDGVIKRISHQVLGPGFTDGSGALVWSILIDGVPVKNYAAMTVQLGSIGTTTGAGPRPIDGILAKSGQVITYQVKNVGYAAVGTNQFASVGGYFYPTPREKGMR